MASSTPPLPPSPAASALPPLLPAASPSQPRELGKIDLKFIELIGKPYAGAAKQFISEQEKIKPTPLNLDEHSVNSPTPIPKNYTSKRLEELENRVALNPKDTFAISILAKFYLYTGQKAKGFQILEEHLNSTDHKSETYSFLGTFYLQAKEFDKSFEAYVKGLDCDPMNTESLIGIALCIKNKGIADKAIADLENEMKLPTAQPLVKQKLAMLYLIMNAPGHIDKGLALLKEIEGEPHLQAQCLYIMAECYKALSKNTEAHSYYCLALEKLLSDETIKNSFIKTNLISKILAGAYFVAQGNAQLLGRIQYEQRADEQLALHPEHPQLLKLKVQVLADKQSHELALQASARFFECYPQDFETWYYRAFTLFKMDRLDEALNFANLCISHNKTSAKLRFLRGDIHLARRRFQHAFCDYYQAKKLAPNMKDVNGRMGYCLYKGYHTPTSITAAFDFFLQEMRSNQGDMRVFIRVCKLFFRINDYPSCKTASTELMKAAAAHMDPKIRQTSRKVYGGALIACQEYGPALVCFEEIWRENQTYLYSFIGQARALNGMKRFREACEVLARGIRSHPDNRHLWAIRAYTYYNLGEFASAGEDAQRAEALGCNDADFLHMRNQIDAKLENWAEVGKRAESIEKLAPNSCVDLFWRGRLLLQQKKSNQAVKYFKDALAAGESAKAGAEFNELAAIYLAKAYNATSSKKEAFLAFRAIKHSTHPEYYIAHAEYCLKWNNPSGAHAAFDAYLKERPKDWAVVSMKAQIYENERDLRSAISAIEAFLALVPCHKEANAKLAVFKTTLEIVRKPLTPVPQPDSNSHQPPSSPSGRRKNHKHKTKDSPPSPPSPPSAIIASAIAQTVPDDPPPLIEAEESFQAARRDPHLQARYREIAKGLQQYLNDTQGFQLLGGVLPLPNKPDLK